VKREKRKKVRDWEGEYWEGIQESAQNAYQRNDQAELFKLSGELQLRPREGKMDVWKNSVEDVEKERDTWRAHFCKVSKGVGEVSGRVWDAIPRSTEQCTWLGAVPDNIELNKVLGKMKVGRAPGEDNFVVELLKYGGKELWSKVCDIVWTMWVKALSAEEGHAADEWPEEWCKGIVYPLWRKKGDRKDKNTWR